jgi:hypothetical protein
LAKVTPATQSQTLTMLHTYGICSIVSAKQGTNATKLQKAKCSFVAFYLKALRAERWWGCQLLRSGAARDDCQCRNRYRNWELERDTRGVCIKDIATSQQPRALPWAVKLREIYIPKCQEADEKT